MQRRHRQALGIWGLGILIPKQVQDQQIHINYVQASACDNTVSLGDTTPRGISGWAIATAAQVKSHNSLMYF